MAVGGTTMNCTIVLHDDGKSTEDILCGTNILTTDEVGFLTAPNAKPLCIAPTSSTRNGDEISVHISVARRFGFENRTKGKVQVLKDEAGAVATHVEITFRDQHLSRADMWRMKAETEDKVAYRGQKLRYLGSPAAEVANVYIAGTEVGSALVSHPQTKLIFRSYSARYSILIQISKEMMQTWRDGDLLFERLLSGFLPDLFRRWERMKVHHQVTVILFGRELKREKKQSDAQDSDTGGPSDFFHVLVSEMDSKDWRVLMRKLQQAFHSAQLPRNVSLAAEGNLLEAIHLTAMDFADDNLAPPTSSTGTSIIAVTAGAGLFEAEHDFLKRTTELLLGNSIGVDIVSLSSKPLHPVPLFEYELGNDTEYALPHWLDISFWEPEIQNMSRNIDTDAKGDVTRIALPLLVLGYEHVLNEDVMSAYDEGVFGEESDSLTKTLSHETTIEVAEEPAGHRKTPSTELSQPLTGIDTLDMQPLREEERTPRTSTDSAPWKALSTASVPLTSRAKREGLPPHPLMQSFRKISVGPKGLAPSQGVASTTVSAHHVQQERDMAAPTSPPRDNPSLLAKQIRDSLRRKPSQQTLAHHQIQESNGLSKPIVIRTSEEIADGRSSSHRESDPAIAIEKAVMDRESGPNSGSYSATPRTRQGSLPLPGLSSFDLQDGSNTPWLTLLNPCDPRKDNMRIASEYRKWQSVFPRAISSGAFKWDSMCCPASLPLMTEIRMSMTDLERHFVKKVRRILVLPGQASTSDNAQSVLHELVALRLTAGFQIVPTRKIRREQIASDHIEKILLSLGSYYHELWYLSEAEIQVTEYERTPRSEAEEGRSSADNVYTAKVRSVLSKKSRACRVTTGSMPFVQDWSIVDDHCANPSAAADEQGVCKMRFALIPVQPSHSDRTILTEEERRIDGIQRLTIMWQRHRYTAVEDEQNHASMVKPKGSKIERDPNPLAIEYQTRDPSAVVNGLATTDQSTVGELDAGESDVYHSSNFDITKLVKHLQEPPPNGVELRDRRWFTRLHFKCFRGDEMCNWILRVFKDLRTREEAIELGKQLMNRDIFTHVRGKHEFRDGHYFYQIKGAYRTTEYADSAGLFSKAIGRSMPSTPMVEMKQSPNIRAIQGESDSSSKGTPTSGATPIGHKERKKILLTEKLQYNVDPNKKSQQLEIIDLHYDRIHNPENCYHMQVDWTSTTPKLIREAVARWSAVVDGYGLKLVQLPMSEACKLYEQHPLDQVVSVKLALRPPRKVPVTPVLTAGGASPIAATEDALAGHKALLKKMDFVLDLEAAAAFPTTVDVTYSWGKPEFELTQFVHKSGLLLVQIANKEDADFFLLPNRLAPQPALNSRKAGTVSLDDVVAKFKAFCKDEEALRIFYHDLNKPKADLTSPFARANQVVDFDIPPMELPPHLTHRVKS